MRFFAAAPLALWAAASLAAVSAVDSDGNRLTLAAPAQRIASLAPHVTELLFAAGAGAKVVAVSEFSDFPAAALRLPRVASSAGVDIERILALRSDLAVAWRLEATAKALDRLRSLGIPVFYIEPHRLEEIPQALESLGVLAGTGSLASREAARLREELTALRTAYRGRTPLEVFYQISDQPLMTVNGRQLASDAIALCGGRNVFAEASIIAPVVSAEAVLAADPQVILASRASAQDRGWEAFWSRFPALRAVRLGNLMAVKGEELNRHGPRAVHATRRLCELLDRARANASAGPR